MLRNCGINSAILRTPPHSFIRHLLLLISFATITLIITMFGIKNYDASVVNQTLLSNKTEVKNAFKSHLNSVVKTENALETASTVYLSPTQGLNQANRSKAMPIAQEKQDIDIISPPTTSDVKCEMKTKIAFAKTHKTGSSTVQNILFRFGLTHNLTFSLPPNGWMFSNTEPFKSTMVLQGPFSRLKTFDIFAFHSIWNYEEVKKVIPKGTFMTILRDPVDTFESNYVYMGLESFYKKNINQFAREKARQGLTRSPGATSGKNQLLWDLGISSKAMEDPKSVNQMIMQMEEQFNLVMIAEKFEESLILLGEIMCWPLEELTYLRQNERLNASKSNITVEAKQLLNDWLWADHLLYKHFVKRLDDRIESYGRERMRLNVEKLKVLNEKLEKECVKAKGGNEILKGGSRMSSKKVQGYVVDDGRRWCIPFALSEPKFTKRIRLRQMKKMMEQTYNTLA